MKKLITENEKNDIRKLHSLDEDFFSDILDKLTGFFKGSSSDSEKKDDKKVSSVTASLKKGKITQPSQLDKSFYEEVLKGIGAPITSENLAFFYAWRQAEGAKASFNPFNTTHKKDKSTLWNCLRRKEGKCVVGVRNYSDEDSGIDATIKTLKNGRYGCIVDGLKKNIGARKIAECKDLKTWGTGEGVSRVINSGNIKPPAISRTLVKKI